MLERAACLAIALVAAGALLPAHAQEGTEGQAEETAESIGFGMDSVVTLARALSRQEFEQSDSPPQGARDLDYDAYRRITFVREREDFPDQEAFRLQYVPRGSIYSQAVAINIVRNGTVVRRDYSPSDFRFYDLPLSEDDKVNLGFAGFRVTGPLNRPGKFDEIVSFIGASYFRALGTGNVYGTSARGLAIRTASPQGEEFPRFKEFWIVEPEGRDRTLTVFALMDSPSVSGAYKFVIEPDVTTTIDVEAVLFPRRKIEDVGIAPLSSMFEFGPHDPLLGKRDFRPAVHDTEGLAVHLANGERLWRPVINPQEIEISSFAEQVPLSFGLEQRERRADAFSDLEADYEDRPSVTITPLEGWTEGQLVLVEIPTPNEFNDNIVAFWRPREAWERGQAKRFRYRLAWGLRSAPTAPVAEVAKTRIGREIGGERPLVVIDFETGNPELFEGVEADVTAANGEIRNVTLQPGDAEGRIRLSFLLQRPDDSRPTELRAALKIGERQVSETWLYRWTDL